MALERDKKARGYIASGYFKCIKHMQHIQNHIIRNYCENNDLIFVLSRAEYAMPRETQSQLWAALKEGFENIVFYSLHQLPTESEKRHEILRYCISNDIALHFAVEGIIVQNRKEIIDLELLIAVSEIHDTHQDGNSESLLKDLCN